MELAHWRRYLNLPMSLHETFQMGYRLILWRVASQARTQAGRRPLASWVALLDQAGPKDFPMQPMDA